MRELTVPEHNYIIDMRKCPLCYFGSLMKGPRGAGAMNIKCDDPTCEAKYNLRLPFRTELLETPHARPTVSELMSELLGLCKCGINIEVNPHRNYYESVDGYFETRQEDQKEIIPSVYVKMVELDTIIEIQAYPETSIGFYLTHHYDMECALIDIIRYIKEKK